MSEDSRAAEENMTAEERVMRKNNNNISIWLGNIGITETGSEGWEGYMCINNTDLKIIYQKVVAEALREDEFSFQLHPNEQLSFD